MRPSKGTLKYGHIRQVVTIYRFVLYGMHCDGKLKLKSHNTSSCLIEVVTKAGLTVGCECFYLCRLFTIDWFKPEIVTGQYNSCTGISNVIFPGGHGK
jgi:hypothetical protein